MTVRAEVEDFLFDEAALLDRWQLDEWLALFTDDATYVVPNTDVPDADPATDLVLIVDDLERLRARVKRLESRRAHREFPHSRTRRHLNNVRIVGDDGTEIRAETNFIVHRFRDEHAAAYVGTYSYTLRRVGDTFAIAARRAELDNETLRPHGTVSIIL